MKRKRSRWDVKEKSTIEEEPPTKRRKTNENSEVKKWGNTPISNGSTPLQNVHPVSQYQKGSSESEKQPEPEEKVVNEDGSLNIPGIGKITMEEYEDLKWQYEMRERNGPLSDEDLDEMFPIRGYKILEPPANYNPEKKEKQYDDSLLSSKFSFYSIPETIAKEQFGVTLEELEPSLPQLKPDDVQFFSKLLDKNVDEDKLTKTEIKEREVMKLILKIKNGTPIMRKHALKYITNHARYFGAKILFEQLIPLLMSPTLEELERHYLMKVLDRMIYKLDDEVRLYTHKILVVVEPLLIDADRYVRAEGREVISNLSKAVGLAQMIAVMRTDIASPNEYVRNTTARTFAVVATALGLPSMMTFLRAVCKTKKSWEARHTGMKIFQQIALLLGCGVLPHLKEMVSILKDGLEDPEMKVRVMTAYALSALAEASYPYGIESFDLVLRSLFFGISTMRNRPLAAFLRALGAMIPLMTDELAGNYAKNILSVLMREFYSQDEEMRFVVLRVLDQCVSTGAMDPKVIQETVLPEFVTCFWVPSTALQRKTALAVVNTTVSLAKVCGEHNVVGRLVHFLKHGSEPFRKIVLEAISKILQNGGIDGMTSRLEERLIDGALYTFQNISSEDGSRYMLPDIGRVFQLLGKRCSRYLPRIGAMVKHRLTNHESKVRREAAEFIIHLVPVIHLCGEERLLQHLGMVLYENLGEEFPEVLGGIVGALKAIVDALGMDLCTPPVKDLLPRLTVILKNRHVTVQQHTIDLVGLIAARGSEHVPEKEWMRICFELLEMLKAHRKSVRRSAMNAFGSIAVAIGPQEVISTLLSNLRVQERQLRVCTTIAIAIVGECCSPFTILPALMNEYKVPEQNVQNGVLKALSFLFEYIGEMSKDYIYAMTPLLEDALTDRDQVHRQMACNVVKHISVGVVGMGYEEALQHLLNLVWPNLLEQKAVHVINAVVEAIDALRLSLGVGTILYYTYTGLFHPARKVRNIYWRIYNDTYIYNSDAMVAFLPRIKNRKKTIDELIKEEKETDLSEDYQHKKKKEEKKEEEEESKNDYNRHYLDLFI